MSRNKLEKFNYSLFARNFNKIVNKNGGKYIYADKIGVTYESVNRWCNGEGLPGGPALLKIHEKSGISIDWLLTGKNPIKCPFCGDWTDNIRDAVDDVKEILESDDEIVRTALQSNLAAFRQSIEKNKKGPPGSTNKPKSGKRARDQSGGVRAGADPAAKSVAG